MIEIAQGIFNMKEIADSLHDKLKAIDECSTYKGQIDKTRISTLLRRMGPILNELENIALRIDSDNAEFLALKRQERKLWKNKARKMANEVMQETRQMQKSLSVLRGIQTGDHLVGKVT